MTPGSAETHAQRRGAREAPDPRDAGRYPADSDSRPAAHRLEPLGRGDVYRLLALALDYPSADVATEVEELLRDLVAVGSPGLPGSLSALAWEWSARSASGYQGHFHRLFDTQGALGYCESAWRHVDRGSVLRDVTAFYSAFGFAAARSAGQPDSVRHELAFMSYLAFKEWFAAERALQEEAAVTQEAQASFLGDHLGCWAGTFAARLAEQGAGSVYEHVAATLAEWIAVERTRLGVKIPPWPRPASVTDPLRGGCPAA